MSAVVTKRYWYGNVPDRLRITQIFHKENCFSSVPRTCVERSEGGEYDHQERGGVLPGVDEMREGVSRVSVSSQTLGEPEPGWQAVHDGTDDVGLAGALLGSWRAWYNESLIDWSQYTYIHIGLADGDTLT